DRASGDRSGAGRHALSPTRHRDDDRCPHPPVHRQRRPPRGVEGMITRRGPCLAALAALLPALAAVPGSCGADAAPKLLIAFASYRDRPKHPNIYFYEHDGVANGKIVGMVGGTPAKVADAYGHPTLTHDGRLCAFTHEVENRTGRIVFWDRKAQKVVDP